MNNKIIKSLIKYFLAHKKYFFISLSIYTIGISIGLTYAALLPDSKLEPLNNILSNINDKSSLLNRLVYDIEIMSIVLLFGISFLGVFLIPFIVLYKGFSLGFTSACLSRLLAGNNVIKSLFILISKNFLWVFIFLFACTIALHYSNFSLAKMTNKVNKNIKRSARISYITSILLFFVLIFIVDIVSYAIIQLLL